MLPAIAAADPALVWSQQKPTDSTAVFLAGHLSGERHALFSVPVAPGYTPLASISPDGAVLAATTLPGGHPERDGLLWRADLKTGALRQVDSGVLYMERPIALDGGDILYMRVTELHPAPPERTRLGELDSVRTEVRLLRKEGPARTLHSDLGYGLHFAGRIGDELVLYRVARDEAAFYALPLKGGAVRRLASAPTGPFARDFSVQDRKVIFAATDGTARRAKVYALDFDAARVEALFDSANGYPAPLATPKAIFHVAGAPGFERLQTDSKTPITLLDGGLPFPLAAGHGLIAVRRQTAESQELWLLEAKLEGRKQRLANDGFFSVAGFAEAP